jgi:hypothetical protein
MMAASPTQFTVRRDGDEVHLLDSTGHRRIRVGTCRRAGVGAVLLTVFPPRGHKGVDDEPILWIEDKIRPIKENRQHVVGYHTVYERHEDECPELAALIKSLLENDMPAEILVDWFWDKAPDCPGVPEHFTERFLAAVARVDPEFPAGTVGHASGSQP